MHRVSHPPIRCCDSIYFLHGGLRKPGSRVLLLTTVPFSLSFSVSFFGSFVIRRLNSVKSTSELSERPAVHLRQLYLPLLICPERIIRYRGYGKTPCIMLVFLQLRCTLSHTMKDAPSVQSTIEQDYSFVIRRTV